MSDEDLSEDQSRLIARAVREALARNRLSRQGLADRARISISTLEKALSGRRPFTLATTVRLEEALATPLRTAPVKVTTAQPAHAPEDLGSYSRESAAWIEGRYLTLRPSFNEAGGLFAYQTEIAWDAPSLRLVFRESERLDSAFTQTGFVSLPHESGHIYLVTVLRGQYRLMVLGRPTIAGEMYGILTTLRAGRGSRLTPVATPIAMIRARGEPQVFGRIVETDACHAEYKRHLDRVIADEYAMFLG